MTALTVGVFSGALFWSVTRTGYYIYLGIQPEMSPMMFIVFAPVLAIVLLVPVAVIEIMLSIWWWWPKSFLQGIALGIVYTTVLAGLVHPLLLICLAAANPIALRAWFIYGK